MTKDKAENISYFPNFSKRASREFAYVSLIIFISKRQNPFIWPEIQKRNKFN